MMKIGLETESAHLFFQQGVWDIFDFIEHSWRLGCDGVQINIITDVGLHPEYGTLNSRDPEYLRRVRRAIEERGMYCELDNRFTSKEDMEKTLYFAKALGCDAVRIYMYRLGTYDRSRLPQLIQEIKEAVPLLKKYRIRLGIENHEEETADDLIEVIEAVDSPWVGAHCDIGNGMMVWEDPLETVRKLAPYTVSTHFKDHIVTMDAGGEPVVCGVPVGEGSIDVDECFRLLVEHSMVTRINLEACFPYASHFWRRPPVDDGSQFSGAFALKEPPFDFNVIKPLEYYYPAKISREQLKIEMKAQMRCIRVSLEKLHELNRKYCL